MSEFSNDTKGIIDADFVEVDSEEILKDKEIKREPLYYTRSQVAKILGEKESTVSYWGKEFQSLLNIKIINMTKKYTKTNIENLIFIQKLLREDRLTIEQVKQYCSEKGFDNESGLIDTSNPLAIKTFISAMTSEMDKKILDMQNSIIKQQQNMIDNLNKMLVEREDQLKESISITIDDVISDKMEQISENIDNKLDLIQKEVAVTRDLNEKMDFMKNAMEERKKENQLATSTEKQHWWSKLFKK